MTARVLINTDADDLGPSGRPCGHGLCLIEFIGRGYEEIATVEPEGQDVGWRR